MLTEDELATLESLLVRARAAAGQDRSESGGTVNVGDLVQLRPGADSHWQTSLLLVCKIRDDGRVSGVVLRPHRSGSREAWYTYSVPEVLRIGRAPFPPPEQAVNSASYLAVCPRCLERDGVAPPASRAEGQQAIEEPPKMTTKTLVRERLEDFALRQRARDERRRRAKPARSVGDEPPASLAGRQKDGGEIQIGPRLWVPIEEQQELPEPKPKPIQQETESGGMAARLPAGPKPRSVKKAEAIVTVIKSIAGDPWQFRWKSHLPEICDKLDADGVSHPPQWPSWSGQLTASTTPQSYAADLVIKNIAHHIEVYEGQQDGAAPLPEPKPETRPKEQQDGGEIQIGPWLWWVPSPGRKPIQRETGAALQIGQRL